LRGLTIIDISEETIEHVEGLGMFDEGFGWGVSGEAMELGCEGLNKLFAIE
jgi:hypothetical protein